MFKLLGDRYAKRSRLWSAAFSGWSWFSGAAFSWWAARRAWIAAAGVAHRVADVMCQSPYYREGGEWGCGKCLPCSFNHARLWTARIMLEASQSPWSDFVTFTYDKENHRRVNGELSVREAQLLVKRIRRKAAAIGVRYYLIGEYGGSTWRPHYHAILFSLRRDESFYESVWPYGFVYVGAEGCTAASAAYCAGYVAKGSYAARKVALRGRAPEFRLMSRKPGLGTGAAFKMYEAMADRGIVYAPTEVRLSGSGRWPLGRYLRGRLAGWQNWSGGLERSAVSEDRRRRYEAPGREERRRQDGWKAEKRLEIQLSKGSI